MFNHQIAADLQAFNTLAIPAKAAGMVLVESVDELYQVIKDCHAHYPRVLVLGAGSNVILPDHFDGLVILIAIKGKVIEQETDTAVTVSFAAGESWHEAVMWTTKQHLYGIENLALIPGTVGAAPIQNIGAYGVELVDCFEYLEAIHRFTGKLKQFSLSDCKFDYRDSVFKQSEKDQWIIIRVVLKLSKKPVVNIDYPVLREALNSVPSDQLTSLMIAEAVITIRQSKLPDPNQIPNAGSFFKNPVLTQNAFEKLKTRYPEVSSFPLNDSKVKVAAAWLLDQDGWKGKVVDGIAMHHRQALVLTNPQRRSAKTILAFAEQVQQSIQQRFNIRLEIEPMIVDSSSLQKPTVQA